MFSQVRMQSIEGGAVASFLESNEHNELADSVAQAVRQCTHSVPDQRGHDSVGV